MILQTDNRLPEVINKYGCYFMSILFLANKHAKTELSIDKIIEYYELFNELGYMDECYVLFPEEIFKKLRFPVAYNNRHDPVDYFCSKKEIEILCFKLNNYTHFVVGDGKGNISYDPMGTSRSGLLISKRVFHVG